MHLIDKHGYLRNYDFGVVGRGTGKSPSILQSSHAKPHRPRRRVSDVGTPGWRERQRDHTALSKDDTSETGFKLHNAAGKSIRAAPKDQSGKKPLKEIDLPGADVKTREGSEDADNQNMVDEIDAVAQSLSALRFVPLSVRLKPKKGLST